MNTDVGFGGKLWREIVPTLGQALVSLVLALVVMLLSQSGPLASRLGITAEGVDASQRDLFSPFRSILITQLASNIVLIVFWATVGLVAYLICWSFYNFLIEARNEVTLETAYMNRGHWRGHWQTFLLKLVCGAGLVTIVATLHLTIPRWINVSHTLFSSPSLAQIGLAILGLLGLAVNLYLVLVFVQLTFTPWYRVKAFT